MAVAITVNRTDTTETAVIIEGVLTLSGSYTSGGDTINWSAVPQIPSNVGPLGYVEVDEQPASGATPQGYIFYVIAGSTNANWLLWIATAVGQPPSQLGAGAYAAGLTGSTIQFRAYFSYGQ